MILNDVERRQFKLEGNNWWTILRMIVFFVVVVPWLSFLIIAYFKSKKEQEFDGFDLLTVVLVSMVLFIVVSITDQANFTYVKESEHKIVSMQDSTAYIVSRYSVNSDLKYYYTTERSGVFRTYSASSNRSSIRHTDSEPKVIIYKKQKKIKLYKWIMPSDYVDAHKYEFYIPKGAVVQDFNIDLK